MLPASYLCVPVDKNSVSVLRQFRPFMKKPTYFDCKMKSTKKMVTMFVKGLLTLSVIAMRETFKSICWGRFNPQLQESPRRGHRQICWVKPHIWVHRRMCYMFMKQKIQKKFSEFGSPSPKVFSVLQNP